MPFAYFRSRVFESALLLCLFAALTSPARSQDGLVADAQSVALSTTTQLSLSPASGEAGTIFTLKASVVDKNGAPVTAGTVTFYRGSTVLGSGQLVRQTSSLFTSGTATLRTSSFPVGASEVTAKFMGTNTKLSSVSASQTLSRTTLSFLNLGSSGSPADYTLTGTVQVSSHAAPTGTVTFVDATANSVLGKANPGPATSRGFSFVSTGNFAAMGTGGGPAAVVVGDLNHDGILDVVANHSEVAVGLGNGDGTFRPLATYTQAASGSPVGMVLADLKSDGNLDLVVASGSNSYAVMLGNGDGTFRSAVSNATSKGSQIYSVAVADFDNDGNLDIALLDLGLDQVICLLGKGDGTFGAPTYFPVGTMPRGITAGDFNGDGKTDLAVSNYGSSTADVLIGNGNGSFKAAVAYPTGRNPNAIVAADLNGDGKLDLITPNLLDNSVSILLGLGNGTFMPAKAYAVGAYPSSVAVGDLNEDGKVDLAVANYDNADVTVLYGQGNGTFAEGGTVPVGASPNALAMADFNGDGTLDLASANAGSGNVTILLGQLIQYATASITNVAISGSGTHTAIASYPGDAHFSASTSNAVALTLTPPRAAIPTFSLPSGTYASIQSVKITDTTPDVTIYFTGDGTPPSTSSARYTAPLLIAGNEILQAIAVGSSFSQSGTASARYNIGNPAPVLRSGTMYWGADGHRDKEIGSGTEPYGAIPLSQQISDMKAIFEPNSAATVPIFYRAWDDITGCNAAAYGGTGKRITPPPVCNPTQTGFGADIILLQEAGIMPLVPLITYPESDAACGNSNALPGWTEFSAAANPEKTAYNWAYCTAARAAQYVPTNMFWIVGNEWNNQGTLQGNCYVVGDQPNGTQASCWQRVPGYRMFVGAMAGAIKGIRDNIQGAQIIGGANGGCYSVGLSVALATDVAATYGLAWDYTNLHWYNDVVPIAGACSLPDNFYGGYNAYSLLASAGKPLFVDEFGSHNGELAAKDGPSGNDGAAGSATITLMRNLLGNSRQTTTEYGVVGGSHYELYQDPGQETDTFLYWYTGGTSGQIAPQGTDVHEFIVQNGNPSKP